MSGLWNAVKENVIFVLIFLGIIVVMFLLALWIEKLSDREKAIKRKVFSTRRMAVTGMFSAIALALHLIEFPLPFLAPGFYEMDFSELPALIGCFAFGPITGVLIEFCKILLKLMIKGTSTAFVGDLANFVVGCSLILPASAVYEFWKCRKGAITGCIAGIVCMTVFGTIFNGVYLLPKFVVLFGMPMEKIVAAGTAINPAIKDVTTFVCLAVAPFNLIKSGVVSLITMLIYKPLSPILKERHR